ncbi:tetratricopeptide repeat protein [Rummeliibacillus pycnus]|uniref:tetratricopeptide repeat protein n=1 Tax=Rummeliibacillus pycnus TaxID=101070 RepID=UPI000C9CC35C|nr:tetratricopeptide repeat protein [Rummeliibacillus pycnus]
MGIFSMFSKNNKVGGIIKDLQLESFYNPLSVEEKEMMKNVLEPKFVLGYNPYTKKDLDQGNAKWDRSISDFFLVIGKAVSKELSIKLYEESMNHSDNDYVAQHLIKQDLAEKYYQLKQFDKCEEYCKKDIAEIDKYINDKIFKGATVYSFKRLAILYEKQERYNEAIEVCELAMKYNQIDGTKGSYESRLSKLQKKLEKANSL